MGGSESGCYVKMVAGWTSRKFVKTSSYQPSAWWSENWDTYQKTCLAKYAPRVSGTVPNVAFVGHLRVLLGFRRIPLHGPYPYWVVNIMANLGVPPPPKSHQCHPSWNRAPNGQAQTPKQSPQLQGATFTATTPPGGFELPHAEVQRPDGRRHGSWTRNAGPAAEPLRRLDGFDAAKRRRAVKEGKGTPKIYHLERIDGNSH